MSSPMGREPKLEGDVVATKAWICILEGKLVLQFMLDWLPRSATGWGELAAGWRVTLPTGEQGTIVEHWKSSGGASCSVTATHGFAETFARLRRRKIQTARIERIRVERFDENVIAIDTAVAS